MNIRVGIFGLIIGIAVLGLYAEERFHTVQRGETFYSIALALGISAEDLMRYNGIADPARLQAGQQLRIPGTATAAQESYRVVRGDTLYGIARKFSVPLSSILEINGLSLNHVLREGETLKLPKDAPRLSETGSGSFGAAASANSSVLNPVSQGGTRPAEAANAASLLRWPITARELSYMTGKLSGVVITGAQAEPVSSLTWGTVLAAGPYRGFGRVVIVQVDGGYLYVYGGCESLSVKEGDRVGPGNEIGKLGMDAVTNKPQLFFMVYRINNPIDPAKAPRA